MKVLLIGYGYMGQEYGKILRHLGINFLVVSNKTEYKINEEILYGGIENINKNKLIDITHAIIATPIEKLEHHIEIIVSFGIINILVEKPCCLNTEKMKLFMEYNIFVAYNRRFYKSVDELINKINEDGGIESFNFNMTELTDKIDVNKYDKSVLEKWILSMTSHLLDLVFFICGKPEILISNTYTTNTLKWHKNEIFVGYGKCKFKEKDILFSYHGNWISGGRWRIEICTKKALYILCPLEELHIQTKGEFKVDKYVYPDENNFKCGMYDMIQSFLFNNNDSRLVSLKEQLYNIENIYTKIGSY